MMMIEIIWMQKDDDHGELDGDLCFIFSTKVCRLDLQSRWATCFLILHPSRYDLNPTACFVSFLSTVMSSYGDGVLL